MVNIGSIVSVALWGSSNLIVNQATASTPASNLNLTAISAVDGHSILECWQLPDLAASTQSGTVGASSLFLGNTSNVTYSVLPAGFDGGLHNAPVPQLVIFISGLAHVTLPDVKDEAWIQSGRYGVIIAVDTSNVSKLGHITDYPGDADTVAFSIPFEGGQCPNHTVLHRGPCTYTELTGV